MMEEYNPKKSIIIYKIVIALQILLLILSIYFFLAAAMQKNAEAKLKAKEVAEKVAEETKIKEEEEKLSKGLATLNDSRDGKKYKIVKIGQQIWMAENLNYIASGSKCYENQESNCQQYGRLYNWNTAMKACPKGWHLPNDKEWKSLVYFASDKIAGKKLKAKNGWNGNGNGTDDYGFSALPGGVGRSDGSFVNVGDSGGWWSSSEDDSDRTYFRGVHYSNEKLGYGSSGKDYLRSIRCLQG
jgi:uncharacterized protein (TIGR02145 family)